MERGQLHVPLANSRSRAFVFRALCLLMVVASLLNDHGRDTNYLVPRTDTDGRSLAHPVLILDDWRRSVPPGRDGAPSVLGATV